MADPIEVTTNVVTKILSSVRDAKTNEEECKALARMADQTLQVMKTVKANELSDPCATKTMNLMHEALIEAHKAIENCSDVAFFSALLWPESYSLPLKHASDKLKHVLSEVPLALTNMTANIQSDMFASLDQLRHTIFNRRAAVAHQNINLRNELEKAFHQQLQESEEINISIRELIEEQISSRKELKKELTTLKRHVNKARMAKETLEEYALNQIIEVIADSLGDVNRGRALTRDLKESLCCPISKQIMWDPVIVKESEMIYDRATILEWLERGHRHDPLTNVELISKDLAPCHALREVCMICLAEPRSSSSFVKDEEEQDDEVCLSPGLYEGFGKLFMGSSTIHIHQTLFLEPNGRIVSYSMYGKSNEVIQRNGLEIGSGEWDKKTLRLSFGDEWYTYHGKIDIGATCQQSRIKLEAKVFGFDNEKEYDGTFVYFSPHIQNKVRVRPRLVQMESNIIKTRSSIEYVSKTVLCLENDFSVCGWMWFNSNQEQSTNVGRIMRGRWEKEGNVKFSVYFSQRNTPLDSDIAPTNERAAFRIAGSFKFSGSFCQPSFRSDVWKTSDDDTMIGKDMLITPLDGVRRLEFFRTRAVSNACHHLDAKNMQLFQGSTSTLKISIVFAHYVCM